MNHLQVDNNQHSISIRKEGAVDLDRRALLTASSGTLAAAASIGVLAMMNSPPAVAAAPLNTSGWYNLKTDFLAKGDDSTDDTAAWKEAIKMGSTNQMPILVPPGTYRITSPLAIPSYTMIFGSNTGLGFGCRLRPDGCAAFDIGGYHSAIENLMIWPQGAAPDHIISIGNSYSIVLRNIRIHDAQAGLGSAAIKLLGDDPFVIGQTGSNNIIWENLIVRNDSGMPKIAILAARGCGTHRFIAPDFENYVVLFEWQGGQIDLVTPYTERAGKFAINCKVDPLDTSAYLNTYGGTIDTSSKQSVACAIQSGTPSFNSFGTRWISETFAAYVYGAPATPAKFHGVLPNVSGSGPSMFGGIVGWESGLIFPDYILKTSTQWSPTVLSNTQVTIAVNVPKAQLGLNWVRANMNVDLKGLQLSAYVSAPDVVTVVAQNLTDNTVSLNGNLSVACGWV